MLAAAEVGCRPATIRSWRLRAKGRPSPPMTGPGASEAGVARRGDLMSRADDARREEADTLALIRDRRASDPNGARALSQVAKDAGDRAARLEGDARLQREHELRLQAEGQTISDNQIRLLGVLGRTFVSACGFGWGPEQEALFWACLRALNEAERLDARTVRILRPEPESAEARRAIGLLPAHDDPKPVAAPTTAAEIEAEVAAEVADLLGVEPETLAPEPVEPDPQGFLAPRSGAGAPGVEGAVAVSPVGDLPAFDELPADWQRRYRLRPDLGRSEYVNHLRRERRAEQERSDGVLTRAGRQPSFRHPGLSGGSS